MTAFAAALETPPLQEQVFPSGSIVSLGKDLLVDVRLGGMQVHLGGAVVGDLRVPMQALLHALWPGLRECQHRSKSQQQRDR
jgi:hypothetical protein